MAYVVNGNVTYIKRVSKKRKKKMLSISFYEVSFNGKALEMLRHHSCSFETIVPSSGHLLRNKPLIPKVRGCFFFSSLMKSALKENNKDNSRSNLKY